MNEIVSEWVLYWLFPKISTFLKLYAKGFLLVNDVPTAVWTDIMYKFLELTESD